VQPRERSDAAWLCLARARVQLGQWVAALDSYDELAELPTDSAARRLGIAERRQLEARLAWLEVVPSLPVPETARLTLDGEPIAPARLGVAFPVQPGRHWLTLEQQDGVRFQQSWRLAEGEHRSVRLEVAVAAPEPTLPARAEHPAPAPLRTSTSTSTRRGEPADSYARWSRWALYGGGIGTGVGLGLAAASGGLGSHVPRSTMFQVGLGTMLLSGVSIMTGVTLGILSEGSPEQPERPPQPSLQPWLSARGAGVAGSF
jgi:hypothetical protein